MSKIFIAFFFVLFFSFVSAELLVGISPKELSLDQPYLYSGETADFVVSVFNDSNTPVNDIVLKIAVFDGLYILEQENELQQVVRKADSVAQLERKRFFFTVKAGGKPKQDARIVVNYGSGANFSSSVSSVVGIIESPLLLDARVLRSDIGVGGKTSIAVTARNVGKAKLENVFFELVLPAGVYALSPPMAVQELSPGDALIDKGFGFEFDPAISGPKEIVLRVTFLENSLKRTVQKSFIVTASAFNPVLAGILAVIVLLVLAAVFSRSRKQKKAKEEKRTESPAGEKHEKA